MNKISKKIVALATMAAFVLTLVPAAAFADTAGDPAYSTVKTAYVNPDVEIGEDVLVKATVYGSDNETPGTLDNVVIWAEDSQGRTTESATFYPVNNGVKGQAWATKDGVVGGEGNGTLKNGQEFIVNFSVEGTYTIHAGQIQTDKDGVTKIVKEVNYDKNYQTITVGNRVANAIKFTKEDGSNLPTEKNVVTLDILNNFDGFEVNGVDTLTIKGHVTDKNDKVVRNESVTMSADKTAIELAKTETTTDNQGNFEVTFALKDFVNGNITVKCGDLTYVLKIVAAKADAQTITTSLEDGYVLAGTDSL